MATVHEQQTSEQGTWRPRPTLLGTLLAHRYRLTQVLGQGSTGAVFRADDVLAGRTVAVRILHPSLARDQELISRIRARIDRNAKVQQEHAEALINLVDIIDIGATLEGEVFVVTDHLDGDHLSWMLARGGRLPWTRAKPLFIRLCQLVHGLHQHGIVLGTLQSRRCFAVRNRPKSEAIKIAGSAIDEHVAGHIGPHAGPAGVEAARYASPELACGEPIDPRADVYSLGVIAYELLTGRPPFVDSNAMRLVAAHLYSPPPPLRQVVPDAQLPGALEEIILKALAKAPADRHANMDVFAAALTAIPEHEAVVAPYPGVTPLAPVTGSIGHAPTASPAEPPRVAPPPVAPPPLAPPVVGLPKFAPSVVMRGVEPAPTSPTVPAAPPVPPPPTVGAPRRPPSVPMPAAVLPSLRLGSRPFGAAPPAPLAPPAPMDRAAGPVEPVPADMSVAAAAVPADRSAAAGAAAEPVKPLDVAMPTPFEAAAEIPTRPAREPTLSEAAAEIPARPLEAVEAKPGEAEAAKPGEAKPAETEAKPGEAEAKPAETEAKPGEAEAAKAVEAVEAAKPVEAVEAAKPVEEAKPIEATEAAEAKPVEEARPAARLELVKSPDEASAPGPVKEAVIPPLVAAAREPAQVREQVTSTVSVPRRVEPVEPRPAPAVSDLRAAALKQSTGTHPSLSQISGTSDSIIAELPRRGAPWAAIVGLGAAIAAGTVAYIQTQDSEPVPGGRAPVQQTGKSQPTQPLTPRAAADDPGKATPGPIAKVAAPDPLPERGNGVVADPPSDSPPPDIKEPTAVPSDPPEEPVEKPSKKSDKKSKKKTVRVKEVEPEEEDVFDQLRKHMEAKKAAEAARAAGIGTPQPTPAPAPAKVETDDAGAKARDTLDRARQAASQGNHTLAYNLAKQSNGLARSTEAIELMDRRRAGDDRHDRRSRHDRLRDDGRDDRRDDR